MSASNHFEPQTSRLKQNRILACVLCQHRKIKCDRNFPCSHCIKANVTCTPSVPAPARKRRRPNQDLQERLARCEALLKQYASGTAPAQEKSPVTATSALEASFEETSVSGSQRSSIDAGPGWKSAARVVNDDGNVRLMDSYLWASVYEELNAMRNIVDSDDPEDPGMGLGAEALTPDNPSNIFFAGVGQGHQPKQPDPVHIFRLWQIFLERAHPLLKIVHAPSLQSQIMEAATDILRMPYNIQALLYSILAVAVVCLNEAECVQMLGMSQEVALATFTGGTKDALTRHKFLCNNDMPTLQALLLYMFGLQGRFDRHAAWIMYGTVIRIAQKMGYHRDGDILQLPPFETEMRRRIWWHIVLLDAKYAMCSGLSNALLPVRWDTKPPANLNDADMFPGSTEPFQPREGPTEMAFCMFVPIICKFLLSMDIVQGTAGIDGLIGDFGNRDGNLEATALPQKAAQEYRQMIDDLENQLKEAERKYVDPAAGKVNVAALTTRPMLISKLKALIQPLQDQPEWGKEIFTQKDFLFKLLVISHESNTSSYEAMDEAGFLWFYKMHFQPDAFAVLTGQLCRYSTGSLADRAWTTVERIYTYHPEMMDVTQKPYAAQAQFTLKAWKAREEAFAAAGKMIDTPSFIARLRDTAPSPDSRSGCNTSATPPQAAPKQITDLDQFLGPWLDVSARNWEGWADDSTSFLFSQEGPSSSSNNNMFQHVVNGNLYINPPAW